MTAATYYVNHNLLNYSQPDGSLMYVWCESLEQAKAIVRNLPVKQVIHVNLAGTMGDITEIIKHHHAEVI